MNRSVSITIEFQVSDDKIDIQHLDRVVDSALEKLIHDSLLHAKNVRREILIKRSKD